MYFDNYQLGLRPRIGVIFQIDTGMPSNSEESALKNALFSSDERTGAPKNDIGVFMSKETSPEVKDYMQNTIMCDIKDAGAQISEQELSEMSADDIFNAMPNRGETREQYENRVLKTLEEEKEKVREKREQKKKEKFVKDFMSRKT